MALEKTLIQYQKSDIIRSGHEVLESTMKELNLLSQDLIHLSAYRLNENISRNFNRGDYHKKSKLKDILLDMSNYQLSNYNQEKWEMHNNGLTNPEKVKLDFQVLLYAITSEPLLREYYFKRYMGEREKELAVKMRDKRSYAQLVSSFASEFSAILKKPNGRGFQIKNYNIDNYIKGIYSQVRNGASAKVLIDDLLDNFAEYYVSD
jgi:hypothetical protein